MSIGIGITIWLDSTGEREDIVVEITIGYIITRGLGSSRLITRGFG